MGEIDVDNSTVMNDPQTMLCAHWEPPYCDLPVKSQDLCERHYGLHWSRKDLPPTFERRQVGHKILSYDEASSTGVCFICGPRAAVVRTRRGYLNCVHYVTGLQRIRKTGWLPEQYDLAVIEQAGLCAICGNPPAGRGPYNTLVADHCHATGARRKLLCTWCNTGIGLLGDDPARLRAAAAYVSP